jgi:hypothetical protein
MVGHNSNEFLNKTSTAALANARVLFVECEYIEVFFCIITILFLLFTIFIVIYMIV